MSISSTGLYVHLSWFCSYNVFCVVMIFLLLKQSFYKDEVFNIAPMLLTEGF
jgi:hypothetical protein